MDASRAPERLDSAGRSLWSDVTAAYELRPDEERILAAACRTLDETGRLERALKRAKPTVAGSKGQDRPNPLYGEVRAHRLALKGLLIAVGLEEDDASAGAERSHAGRKLARQRWSGRGAA